VRETREADLGLGNG